jgi:hypothetical protein
MFSIPIVEVVADRDDAGEYCYNERQILQDWPELGSLGGEPCDAASRSGDVGDFDLHFL